MTFKQWIVYFFLFVFSFLTLFMGFNYTIDPLWTFCHSNRFNNAQPGFNERQLKTNRAYFCGLENYDTLLLGSSRTTYINQKDFKDLKVFNYASVSMYPIEYRGWIEQAKKIKKEDFKTIILGVDFFGSSDGAFARQQMQETPKASDYLKISSSFFYRYKTLLLIDTFYKSLESIEHSKNLGTIDYSRENIKQTIRISEDRKMQAVQHQKGLYSSMVYGNGYHYNKKVKGYLESLRIENPNTKFIVFTTPISKSLFKMMVNAGNVSEYKQWITMLVEVFGEIYNFMGLNTITDNPINYADLHHFYPEIGTLIADKIMSNRNKSLPKDFGLLLNKKNLKPYLEVIDQEVKLLNP